MSIATPNLVEADEIAKNLPDIDLRKAASFGNVMVPPIVALGEITRRKEMRDRYQKARNNRPEATIKDQILKANPLDMGVMANVPQRTQMASTGAVVRASNGQRIDFNQGTPVDTIGGRLVDFRGEMQRLAEEREMYERIAKSRAKLGYSNEYLGEENIDQLVGDNIPYKDFVEKREEEAYLNPSDQGIGTGNALQEDAENFMLNKMPSGYSELRGRGIDPDSKTLLEQYYGDDLVLASAKPSQNIITSITPNDPPPKPVIKKGVADPYTKEILEAAKAEAFKLTDEDIAAFTPDKDDILSGFLMNYGASLAGGDHAGGLKKGIASVAKDRKAIRAGSQLKALANMKAEQAQATAKVDALYKAGSLDINELTANVSNNVEKGRLIRAYGDLITKTLSDRQEMDRLRNSSIPSEKEQYNTIMRQAAEVRKLMSIMANRNLQTISQGGIVSVI